ncbi:MAG: hypothetical protein ACLRZ9_02100 [Eubacterium sp.]
MASDINKGTHLLNLSEDIGINYERISEFSTSTFREVYYEAFRKTIKLVEQNKQLSQNNSWESERIYNVIPFWGSRGAGKTSVMKSFVGELGVMKGDSDYKIFRNSLIDDKKDTLPESMEGYNFICLDCIDGSMMEENENICGIIFAKMLEILTQEEKGKTGNEIRRIKRENQFFAVDKSQMLALFDKVHDSLCDIEDRRNSQNSQNSGLSSVDTLRNLSHSMDLRERINELVQNFLGFVSANRTNSQQMGKEFLVVSIDDLDMNKKNGYMMLEQLHRYFMVPNVIIYITASGDEVLSLCYKHFVDKKAERAIKEGQKKLAKSYIDKVLPFSNRIYMPEVSNGMVEYKIEKGKDEEKEEVTLKEYFLKNIAEKTWVHFDGCGQKTHFYQPGDLRILTNFDLFLKELPEIYKENKFDKIAFERNIDKLFDDVCNRLATDKLDTHIYQYFMQIKKMSPDRQGYEITQFFIRGMEEGIYIKDYRRFMYSYGELLKGIYVYGRKGIENKLFIHCVLALETLCLTNIYRNSFTISDNNEYQINSEERDKLIKCMCSSISGSWGNKLLPKIGRGPGYISATSVPVAWGYIEGSVEKCIIDIDESLLEKDRKEIVNALLEDENVQLVKMLETLLLFISNKNVKISFAIEEQSMKEETESHSGIDETVSPKSGDGSADSLKKKLTMSFDSSEIRFDILGFVLKSMSSEDAIADVHESIADAIVRFEEDLSKKEDIKREIAKHSMQDDFKEWEKANGYLAMPVHSTDIVYNVIKRAKDKCYNENPHTIKPEDIFDNIKRLFLNIGELLGKEDEFYNSCNAGIKTEYQGKFAENPLVKIITEDVLTQNAKSIIQNAIVSIAKESSTRANDESYWGDDS